MSKYTDQTDPIILPTIVTGVGAVLLIFTVIIILYSTFVGCVYNGNDSDACKIVTSYGHTWKTFIAGFVLFIVGTGWGSVYIK